MACGSELETSIAVAACEAFRFVYSRMLVGSNPGVSQNRHNTCSHLSNLRHKPVVFFSPQWAPASRVFSFSPGVPEGPGRRSRSRVFG
jgi:hypothetical protein